MLAYQCKQCKKFMIMGYVNEYDEFFCTKNCYEKYCKTHGYTHNPDNILEINSPFKEK